jgi:hypothetical protein
MKREPAAHCSRPGKKHALRDISGREGDDAGGQNAKKALRR